MTFSDFVFVLVAFLYWKHWLLEWFMP